jgi:predicted porin
VCPAALSAQETDTGGTTVTFGIGQRLEYIEEEGFSGASSDEGLRSLTSISFGIVSETRSQGLSFGVSTGVAQNLTNGGSTEFESTRVSLDYRVSNRNTELTFGGFYLRDEVDDLAFDTSLADDTINTGIGQREVFNLTTGLTVGRDGPITGTLTHVFEKSEYSDTTDPSLNDSHTQSVEGRLSFQLAPNLEAYVFGNWSDLDEQGLGSTDRETSRLGIGATYEVTPATTLTGEVAYSTEESRGAVVDQSEGLNYAFSLAHARPNGEISVRFSEDDTLNGKRRQLMAGRSYVLRRGELSFSLGATKTDGFGAQPIASLSFNYEIDRNSDIEISLEQSAGIDSANSEVINTRLNVEYERSLTSLSQISAGLSLVEEDVLTAGGIDRRSIRFNVSHAYQLGGDWDLVSGFSHSSVREDAQPTRKRNTLFLGIQKSFSYRP